MTIFTLLNPAPGSGTHSPRVGHYLGRLLRVQLSEVERDGHAVHVAARRGGPGVEVGVGVDPYHTGVGVGLQVSGEGSAIWGRFAIISSKSQHNFK